MNLGATQAYAQEVESRATVLGVVVDAETGDPLPGAHVTVEGTNLGAVTDAEGRFRLRRVPPGAQTLVVRYLGFETRALPVDVPAGGQLALAAPVVLAPQAIEIAGVTVTARASGITNALNQQRTAPTIQNVVSQEQMQRFADPNVSDALRRVPGISTFEHRGEAASIFIRGMAPNLNVVTLDGERLATTGRNDREVSLQGLSTDIIGSVEVKKAVTPDMDADATGGTVNLVVNRLVGDQRLASATLAGGLSQHVTQPSYNAAVNYGAAQGPLSYVVRLNVRRDHRAMDDIRHFWGSRDFGQGEVDVLEQLRLGAYEFEQDRTSVSGRLDARLSPDHAVYVRGLLNHFDKRGTRHQYRVRPESGRHLEPGVVTNARVEPIGRRNRIIQTIASLTAGGESALGPLDVDYSLTYSEGRLDQPFQEYLRWQVRGLDLRYDLSNRQAATYEFLNGTEAQLADLRNYRLTRYENRIDDVADRDWNARLNVALPFALGAAEGRLQAGGRFFTKQKRRAVQIREHRQIDGTFTMDAVASDAGYRRIVGGRYDIGHFVDWRRGIPFAEANMDRFGLDLRRLHQFSDPDHYRAQETIAAAYAMATLEQGPWTLLGGVRFEDTQTTYEGLQTEIAGDEVLGSQPREARTRYANLFPMVHLRYALDERTNLRLAWTNTIARPNFTQFAPYQLVSFDDLDAAQPGVVEEGNPNLRPARVTNLDLMGEHYLRSGGLLAAGLFYKRLLDFIYRQESVIEGGAFDRFLLVRPENGSDAHVYGFELAWQQRLHFLPGVLSGLGVQASYTHTASVANLADVQREERVQLPRIIPHVVNAALTYERGGFFGLVSLNHQSTYLYDVSTAQVSEHRSHLFPTMDRYLQAMTRVDATVSQYVGRGLQVFGEANNLTNAAQTWWDGGPEFHYRSSFNFRTFRLGVRYAL